MYIVSTNSRLLKLAENENEPISWYMTRTELISYERKKDFEKYVFYDKKMNKETEIIHKWLTRL